MKNLKREMELLLSSLTMNSTEEGLANDIKNKFNEYSVDIEKRLLQCALNLGHPAYGISSSNTIAIDELREQTLDFLGVPK